MANSVEQIKSLWEKFLIEHNYQYGISHALDNGEKSIVINYWDIEKFQMEFADELLNNPILYMHHGKEIVKALRPPDATENLSIEITNLPEVNTVNINKLRAEHVRKLVEIPGLVRRASEVRPAMVEATYRCSRCNWPHMLPQSIKEENEPICCEKEWGGCGRSVTSTSFKRVEELSVWRDTQIIEISDSPEGVRTQPQTISVQLAGDLTGKLELGDRVSIVGIVMPTQRKKDRVKLNLFDIYLNGLNLDIKERGYEDVVLSEEDITKIETFVKQPDYFEQIVDGFAPSIYGMIVEKSVLILQLAGGVHKTMPDETEIRGDLHIQLVGDPSTAKSQLLEASRRTAPRSIKVSGKQVTPAGLTATVNKDYEFGGGRWVLSPGAMVLADGGLFVMDEIDKLSSDSEGALHEALEQQTVSVAKASITASLRARCSLLAGANPVHGRFDLYEPVSEQIDMQPALLSRFDIILPITDAVSKERDQDISMHVLKSHRVGELQENIKTHSERHYSKRTLKKEQSPYRKDVTRDFIRKLLAYSKINCFPVMPIKIVNELSNYYTNLRKTENDTVAITVRQLEGLIRLVEASARLRLSNKVEPVDVELVKNIMEYYLKTMSSQDGILDIDIIATGMSSSNRQKMINILACIKNLDPGAGVSTDVIIEETKLDVDVVETLCLKLQRDGKIFSPKDFTWKVV